MPIAFALGENPTRFILCRQARVAVLIGRGPALLYFLGFTVEQTKLHAGDSLAFRERKDVNGQAASIAFPNRAQIGELNNGLRANAFVLRGHGVDRFRSQQDRSGLVFTENFVPVQRERLRLIDSRVGLELAFPDYLPRQLFDVDAIVHFVRRQIVGLFFVVIVRLHRHWRCVACEESRCHVNARHVDREQTKAARAREMLMGGEILEVKPRRDFLKDGFIRLRTIELERFACGQTRLDCDTISNPERELALEGDSLVFYFRREIFRHGRD